VRYLSKLLSAIPAILISNLIWMHIIMANPETITSFEGHPGIMGYVTGYLLSGVFYVFFIAVLVIPVSMLLQYICIRISKYNIFANVLIHVVVFSVILTWLSIYLQDSNDLMMFLSVSCVYTIVAVISEQIIWNKRLKSL